MRHALLLATGYWLLATIFLTGCNSPFPGMRFSPGEQQKQSAQTADDLAKGADSVGYRPGSPAAATLARSTGPARQYAGEPKNPVDVTPLLEAERGAWALKDDQITAWKLKENLYAGATRIAADGLADLAETIETKGKVAAGDIIHRTAAIVDFYRMTSEFTQKIPIPADKQISVAEQARLDALTDAVDKITAAASAQAARRPTVGEVAEKAEDEALDAINRVGSILESYGLLALLPGAGGVFYAVRKRKAAKAAKAEVEQARIDELKARSGEELARREADQVKADAGNVAARAMELLAAAQPTNGPTTTEPKAEPGANPNHE